MNLWKRMRLAGRVLTRGADGTDMPDGIKPPKRGPATEPLQLSTVFRGVQVLQTAITGLPIVEQRGGRDPAGREPHGVAAGREPFTP